MYIPGRSRTGWRPLRIEMSLAAYATRPLPWCALCRARRQRAATPRSGTRKSWSEGVYPVVTVYQNGATRTVAGGLFPARERGRSGAPIRGSRGPRDDHPNRLHDTRSAARRGTLHDLLFGVPDLGRPTRVVDLDGAHAVADRTHRRVRGDRRADDLRPRRG